MVCLGRITISVIALVLPLLAGGTPANAGIHSVSRSLKYLISSFPNIRTVAYTHLPDTVWRPLFIGNVSQPSGVVADPLSGRLFVADPGRQKIFWYQLIIEDDGLLKTSGHQFVAVDGVSAQWLAVNGLGDLYFTGALAGSAHRAVFRQDVTKITAGNALDPLEVYSRANSGYPNPRVWMPSGVAVNSFDIYWGNEQQGISNGAVCSGTRQNIGVTSALEVNVVSRQVDEVRGMAIAGETVFYLSPQAVYAAEAVARDVPPTNPSVGRVQETNITGGWDPRSIAFDGENTMYWTETRSGIIYQFPSGDTNMHPMSKYIDAPQVFGVTVYAVTGEGRRTAEHSFGMIQQSSATPVENAAFHTHLSAALLLAVGVLVAL